MTFLSEADKQRIAEAIRDAEMKTSGELVTVIAHSADAYLYIPILWASLAALMLPAIVLLFTFDLQFPLLYVLQLATFLGLALLFRWNPLKMRVIPKAVKKHRAGRLAWEQFFAQNVHLTRQRTGVLLFVSVAEHYVEIIADKGINDVVKQNAWDDIVADFTRRVKVNEVPEGFLSAIGACGELLAENFPRTEEDVNELPNRLFEI